ncbi:hypothetical protein TWF696_000225 [Orbilia brochopaga]
MLSSSSTAPAQISTNVYPTNEPKHHHHHHHHKKSSSKLYKQRSQKNQNSNGSLTTIQTSEESPTMKAPPTGDAGRILALMKELRGKMEGEVEYKLGDAPAWLTGVLLIVNETGRLVLVKEDNTHSTIVTDLRGCQLRTIGNRAEGSECTIEISTLNSVQDLKIKPPNPLQYDCWLASLLCWQPIRPAGPNNKMVKTQPVKLATDRKVDRRRNSDATTFREAAIIKVGKMTMWDRTNAGSGSPSMTATAASKLPKSSKTTGQSWRKISCILQENGEFKMYNETDVALLHVLQLSSLSRSAIQHLDPSVLGQEYCIGIYPHYSPHAQYQAQSTPIYIGLETKILFEVWFVLLRAYTVPELYGPAGLTSSSPSLTPVATPPLHGFDFGLPVLTDAFRVPRMMSMKIVEAKLPGITSSHEDHRHHLGEKKDTEIFWEISLGGDVRARSMPRVINSTCLWMEHFEFNELPSQLNVIEVVMKQRIVKHKRDRGPTSSNGSLTHYTMPAGEPIGVVTIDLQDLEFDTESEVWWPIMPTTRNLETAIGEVMLKVRKEELVVLMMDEYKPLLDLLQNFSNGLTIQIGQVLTVDLRRVAHTMLKIFQVSGKAIDWLMALAESEIGNLKGGNDISKKDTAAAGAATDAEGQPKPETAPKMDGKRAQMEANILFRGNSLLTKAVEAHMARFGKEYMDETIAEHVQRVAEEDSLFEVDPMKCKSSDDLRHNWKQLNTLVRGVWQSISTSAEKCPLEVKKILCHVRTCVEEKFGNMVEGPSYSSVSGFLFLRFFCPAIMNPKMFGILKDHPGAHAQRTLTLLAKSLQGLANMTTFGVKEPWFEPMNEFLLENTADFKRFIDDVSLGTPEIQQSVQVPPSYATPITIQARLQQASKEGFPSLPFLIDQPRAIGLLVQMWLKWDETQEGRSPQNFSPDLLRFHEICLHLKERMAVCVERAENAERPSSSLSNRWEEVAEGLAASAAVSPALATPGWEGSGSGAATPKENPTIGYLAMSSAGALPPTKVFSPPFSASQHYTRGAAGAVRNGSTSVPVLPEEDESAGAAAPGKNKLSNFVSGLKQKVKGEKE